MRVADIQEGSIISVGARPTFLVQGIITRVSGSNFTVVWHYDSGNSTQNTYSLLSVDMSAMTLIDANPFDLRLIS